MKFSIGVSVMALAAVVLGAGPAGAVKINPIFADTYTGQDFGIGTVVSLSGDAQAQASIIAATNAISRLFTNNVTVNVLYYGAHDGTDGFLGANVTGQDVYSYADYTASLAQNLAAHPGNSVLASAVANLGNGNGAGDPLAFVAPTTAGARVLGETDATPQFDNTGDFVGGNGTVDAIVFLNLDQPLSYTRPIPDISTAVLYDAQSTMEHETDEVFGVGGAGSSLNSLLQDPNFGADVTGIDGATVYGVDDLYRYSNGLPSYVANPNVDFSQSAYFSIDGGQTAVDYYNQEAMAFGDAADWALARNCPGGGSGGAGFVQDAFSCSNQSPDVTYGSPEYIEFEALGMSTPEPGVWAMLLVGFLGLGAVVRRRSTDGVRRLGTLRS